MDLLHGFNEWFWDHNIWLMPGLTWKDVEPTEENGYPNSADLFPSAFYLAFTFLVLRYCFLEPFIFKPLGRAIGIKEQNCKKPPHNKELETLFLNNKKHKIPHPQILKAAQTTGWTEREVERWLRHRKVTEKPSMLFKFCDCSWQLLYYASYCIYGVFVICDKPWFWDIKLCWHKFPFQPLSKDIWWYYMIPLGYYTYMSLTFMVQPQRKDSLQMFLHHIVTIILIVLSFVVNMVRAGALILFVHECADIPLLLGKISGYAGHNSLMDFMFVVFIFCWVITRLIFFPFWIMKNTLFEAHLILDTMYPIYYIFNGLLCVLLTFHTFWTFLIVKIIIKKLKTSQVTDVRSDSDELSTECLEELGSTFPVKDNGKKKN